MNRDFRSACQRGDLQTVQSSIAEVSDDVRTSGLIDAARNGRAEVVQWLIEHGGCYVNARDSEALFEAIEMGHFDVVKVLVEHGVNTNARKPYYYGYDRPTPLMVAAARGKEILRLLLENGADIDDKDDLGQTAIFFTHRLAIVEILVDKGANVNVQDDKGRTPLMIHAEKGNLAIVSYLVAHGADVHRKDTAGQTALRLTGCLTIVEILVDGGANVNVQDDKGRTPLMIHAGKSNKDIVSYLIAHGADIHRKDSQSQTALHYVCHKTQKGGNYTLPYIPECSSDVHRKDHEGQTDLHHSGREIVKLLVDHGSKIEERDCCQFTPLVHAALRGKPNPCLAANRMWG